MEGKEAVRGFYVYGCNPANTVSDQQLIIRGLEREDLFTVVHERFMTDTARYADIVLPATFSVEQTDIYRAYGYCTLSTGRKLVDAPGECRSNWDTFCLLAKGMGYADDYFDRSENEMLDILLSHPTRAIAETSDEAKETLRQGGSIALPFSDHLAFGTETGKMLIVNEKLAEPMPHYTAGYSGICQDYPLHLVAAPSVWSLNSTFLDREHLMARLAAAGYEVLFDSDRTDAKVVVINTCGFIGDAKQESIDMILRAAAAKQAGKIERLFVVGCLSERYADELRAEIPEVDDYFGARTWDGIVRALGASEDPALATERRLTTPKHYAYLKISEGCNWKCGYCAIPLIRGGHVSVPMEELEEEARKLAGQSVRELMVIAQDTTYYGIDLYGRRMLAELLRRLCRIDGIEWIRLHYAYPAGFPDEVIEAMASEPKICKYLDIPFQHISDAQLASMHRRHTKAEAMELIGRLRGAIPDLALRTTLLVGYPGETEADFEELLAFVREVRFERLGVFPYSEEEGTWSAENLRDDIPETIKQQRAERVMALQNEISLENNRRRVGRTERVIIDSRQGDWYVGRTQYDSPEVDQEILIPASECRLLRGHFYDVTVTSAADYDLYGEIAAK